MKIEGAFKEWGMDRYVASSPCLRYHVWIGNGFSDFEDAHAVRTCRCFVDSLDKGLKKRLWREIQAEKKRRCYASVEKILGA